MNDDKFSTYCAEQLEEKNIKIHLDPKITTLATLYELIQHKKPTNYYDTHTYTWCGCIPINNERVNYTKNRNEYSSLWEFKNNKVSEIDSMFEQYSKSQVGIKVDYKPFVCFDHACPKILYPVQSFLECFYQIFFNIKPCYICIMCVMCLCPIELTQCLCAPLLLCTRGNTIYKTEPYCWSNYEMFLLCTSQSSYDYDLDELPCGFFGSTSGNQHDALYCTPICECICFNSYHVDYSFKCDNLIEKINEKITNKNIV